VAPGQILSGSPAFPHREWLRSQAAFQKLPEMKRALAELEKRLKQLEEAVSGQRSAVSKGPDRA
jgi:UDP-3-O-[3-hydroxymyristoyl] glucosamine N-acyltransferase